MDSSSSSWAWSEEDRKRYNVSYGVHFDKYIYSRVEGEDIRCRRPFRLHTASCLRRPWLHMGHAAFHSGPSTSHRELFRLGLKECQRLDSSRMGRKEGIIPKVMPGFSSRTLSRCSLAKNM